MRSLLLFLSGLCTGMALLLVASGKLELSAGMWAFALMAGVAICYSVS